MDSSKQITSLKKLLESHVNRGGYSENVRGVVYQETDFFDFLECQDPYQYLSSYNKVFYYIYLSSFCIVQDR